MASEMKFNFCTHLRLQDMVNCPQCLDDAYARGFAEARERAAVTAENEYADRSKGAEVRHKASTDIAAKIRALSPKPAESGEKGSVKTLTMSQGIKLASIAVHAEEMLSIGGHDFDRQAILGLLQDPEVRAILDAKENAVFLPVKRTNKKTKR